MAVIDIPDRMTLTAPGPDAVATATAQTVGQRGLGVHYYWVVSHFPIGAVVSEPFPVWDAPQPLSAANYVFIIWQGTPGVTNYDLLRTETPELPIQPGNYALATGLTNTQFQDEGQTLTYFDLAGLPRGAPVNCLVHLNNRDYSSPVMEMPCALRVSTLIFPDGTTQWSAGGGGGSAAPTLIGGAGIQLAPAVGPPPTVTISAAVTSVFGRTGAIVAQAGDYTAAQVTNAVSTLGSYADPSWITSLDWAKIANVPAGAVTSVFGRSGAVVAAAGDYTAAQVTNAVDSTSTYADPTWITSLDWDKIINGPPAGATGQVQFNAGGTPPAFGGSADLFWDTAASQLRVHSGIYVKDAASPDAGVQMWYDSAIAGGQGGTYAFDFDAQEYKRYFLDGDPLLLNSDLNSTGNVGIHTDNPTHALTIGGDGTFAILNPDPLAVQPYVLVQGGRVYVFPEFSASVGLFVGSAGMEIGVMHQTYHQWGKAGFAIANDQGESCFLWIGGSDFNNIATGDMGDNFNVMASKDIIFHTATEPPISGEVMRITEAGLIGIGNGGTVPDPAYQLEIRGDINIRDPGGVGGYNFRINDVPVGGAAYSGGTAPLFPHEGMLWFDSSVLRLFVRHSNTWFQVSA